MCTGVITLLNSRGLPFCIIVFIINNLLRPLDWRRHPSGLPCLWVALPHSQHLTCIVSVIILLLEYSAMNSVYKMLSTFGRHSVVFKRLLGMFNSSTWYIQLFTHWKRTKTWNLLLLFYTVYALIHMFGNHD